MANFPKSADVVIIGQGGIVGASVAHHLIERGWENIVGIDKSMIPTDIGSTSHASDFCYMTSHDHMTCYTTMYSADFYEARGHYMRIGGLEVARVGDDERMEELKRKVGSGKAFGTRARMISASEAKERFPLLEQEVIQGALWDPDAGLVVPRSQQVAGELVEEARATGKLKTFANTPATDIDVQGGRICGVHTPRGYIETSQVVLCAGLWGRIMAEMAQQDLPMMPVEHPLLYFGPYDGFAGTGHEIGYPLLRDQGNSAYLRDTGDPNTTEGGQIEWGYYEEKSPRLVHPRDILEKEDARLSPSQRDLDVEQIMEPLERAMELTPILGELGLDEKHSFNGLLSVTADGGSLIGESPVTDGLWVCEAIWVKDGPGAGKVLADWMTDGRTEVDNHGIDVARFYPIQNTPCYIYDRCYETAFKIYNPPVHNREPYSMARNLRRSPFWPREQELGGYFMEAAGWERAHGYAANEHLLERYAERVPERGAEWDARHFWRVSNAEHLALSEDVGMINLSHFAVFDVSGPHAEALVEYTSVAKVGGNTPIDKGVYTNFLDAAGGVRGDVTIIRLAEDRWRVMCGGDTGHRDYVWLKRMASQFDYHVYIDDRTDHLACLGLWGPNARTTLQALADHPEALDDERFPFATAKQISVRGMPVYAFRISYVGEQGWELHVPFCYGLSLWDLLYEQGVTPVGIEMYANSRRLEKSLRLQNADLLSEYNLYEAGLDRPKVKAADFHGKQAYLEQRERASQPAYLCTMTMVDNTDANGVPRYPVGQWPLLNPDTGEVLVDDVGRRSYVTSIAYGPSMGCNIAMGYLPRQFCHEGGEVLMEYFQEHYRMRIEAVGYRALYDPDNTRPKS
ncbi:GcvT family protein [Aquisalimonas asiatica]|uniref:Glycine cleavage system T protein (Aminomethyltransferase) n=1 Tax=Aquisalimonas asiatica TaxID=406100 RepID=A0A1H8Q0H2_9GAMM|nr:FAD-dependent oxidoreductase [Aquisalimonas asiatica]SEO47719.1 Glycine cleavage system T protein (aminomethyltransferase) [Aquisalimonas asiatica]